MSCILQASATGEVLIVEARVASLAQSDPQRYHRLNQRMMQVRERVGSSYPRSGMLRPKGGPQTRTPPQVQSTYRGHASPRHAIITSIF